MATLLAFLCTLVVSAGCGGGGYGASPSRMDPGYGGDAEMSEGMPAPAEPPAYAQAMTVGDSAVDARDGSVPQPTGHPEPATAAAPLLIYNATLTMAVFEANKTIEAVQKLAVDGGGYLVRRTDRSITVRVPAKRFAGALQTIAGFGDVLHREENVTDVTDQFYDLTVRLQNARAMRARLEQLLTEAKDVKDALLVEKELSRVTADIESMEGKLKLMRELISFSTITVDLRPRASDDVKPEVRLPFDWLDDLGLPQLLSL